MTETLDKLYLELSNIGKARNARELHADNAFRQIWFCLEDPTEKNLEEARELINIALKVLDCK